MNHNQHPVAGHGLRKKQPAFASVAPGCGRQTRAEQPGPPTRPRSSLSAFSARPGLCLLAVLLCGLGQAPGATLYVSLQSTNPVPPYTNWTTAAVTIQDGVDAASAGDQVLVNDGVYQAGGRVMQGLLTNRVAVNKPVTVQSLNGPALTLIQGYQIPSSTNGDKAIRCVSLASNAALIGFTLTNGATRSVTTGSDCYGGGAWCESTSALLSNSVLAGNVAFGYGGGVCSGTLINCTLTNNLVLAWSDATLFGAGGGAVSATLSNCLVAGNTAHTGGGTYGGTLNNCTILNNSAPSGGGGVFGGTLNNCLIAGNTGGVGGGASSSMNGPPMNNCLILSNSATSSGGGTFGGCFNNCHIIGNSAPAGGGMYASTLNNCIVYYNNAPSGPNFFIPYYGASLSFCCTTPLPAGSGNVTNAPLLVNPVAGDFHLQPNSPCINAGRNSFITNSTDFDGIPRIAGGTVDIGAYEFPTPTSLISYAWLQQYGLPTDGSADCADPDHDGLSTWQEWKCGTDPTDGSSALRMVSATPGGSGVLVTWQSVANRTYLLQRLTNLAANQAVLSLATNIAGRAGTTTYTDTTAVGTSPFLYRVGVQP